MNLSPVMSRLKGKVFNVISSISITVMLAGGITYYLATTTSAAAVMINGQQVGLVHNITTGNNLIDTVMKHQGGQFGLMAKTRDQITYKYVTVSPAVYRASALDANKLEDKLNYYLKGYKLEADGSVIAVLPTKEDADKVLKEYQDYYVKHTDENKVASVDFAEKVNIEKAEVQPDQIKNVDQVYKTLMAGNITTKNYTVQPKDSWWLIARKNDMLTDEVLAGNPGATKDTKLKPGQIIKIVDSTPYLTVVSQGTYSGSQTIPYDVITKTDTSLGSGQTKVIDPGSNGLKQVTYSYVQKNGIDVTKQVLDEKVVKAPVNRVVAKGPSNKPISVAFAVSRSSGDSSSIVDRALSLQGTRYIFGGSSRSGFDCSGFTKYVYASMGISLPRTSYAQYASGTPVSSNDIRPGDLVFFSTYSRGPSHVGIYIGGGRFVEASNPSSGVKVSSLSDSFYASRYLGARRFN